MDCVDFLISEGHSFTEISNYSIPQLFLFQRRATKRIKLMHGIKESEEPKAFPYSKTNQKFGRRGFST